MWSSLLINAVLSIIIIFLLHQLWEYCKVNYTSQKTKNLVEIHASKYKQIAEDMERNSNAVVVVKEDPPRHPTKLNAEFLPLSEKEWVSKELATFIETL